jgi:hypothetical protein
MNAGSKPIHIYCLTHSGGRSGMESQMVLMVFKTQEQLKQHPTSLLGLQEVRVSIQFQRQGNKRGV